MYYELLQYNKSIVNTHSLHRAIILTILGLMAGVGAYAQVNTAIYIQMDGRRELRLAPKIDTLKNNEEYTFKLSIDPQYQFAELFCERGLAVKVDNFLRVTPNSSKESGIDTVTLRIILFGNGSRILFYKHIYVKVQPKDYQKLIRKQPEEVTMDNMVLERNSAYSRSNFHPKGVFYFVSHDTISPVFKKVVSVSISLINQSVSKSFYIKGDQLTPEVYNEIRKQHQALQAYVRLEVRIGKKIKTIWTRFTMNASERLADTGKKKQLAMIE